MPSEQFQSFIVLIVAIGAMLVARLLGAAMARAQRAEDQRAAPADPRAARSATGPPVPAEIVLAQSRPPGQPPTRPPGLAPGTRPSPAALRAPAPATGPPVPAEIVLAQSRPQGQRPERPPGRPPGAGTRHARSREAGARKARTPVTGHKLPARRLNLSEARKGIVLAAILGPCRAQSADQDAR